MVDKLSSTEMKTIHQSQDTIKKSEMARKVIANGTNQQRVAKISGEENSNP